MNPKPGPKSPPSIFTGTAVAPGIGIGKAYVRTSGLESVPVGKIADREAEKEVKRFQKAVAAACKELDRQRTALRKAGAPRTNEIEILDGHRACLDDPVFLADVEKAIREEKLNLEGSLARVISNFGRIFDLVENTYLKQRLSDIREVASRILQALHPAAASEPPPAGPIILVTEELRVADLLSGDAARVAGVVAEQGARTTHATLMARSLRIPMVVGVAGATSSIVEGTELLVDGSVGTIYPNPPFQVRREYEQTEREFQERRTDYEEILKGPSTTADGHPIQLLASVANPSDLALVQTQAMDGIGLYRTEYPFLQGSELPSEATLVGEYEGVVRVAGDRPLVLRLLNVGSTRGLAGRQLKREPNPALGRRSLRLLLSDPEVFRLQVRAIVRAAGDADVRILLPFVSDLEDLRRARELVREASAEAVKPGSRPVRELPLGVLLEVPALIPMLPAVKREADFLTIGIDNLAQHIMVADRSNGLVEEYLQMSQPGLIRTLRMIVDHAGDMEVFAFGEMARDPIYTQLLLGIGIERFCLPPYSVPRVKSILRHTDRSEAAQFAEEILALETKQEVRERLVERAARFVTASERA